MCTFDSSRRRSSTPVYRTGRRSLNSFFTFAFAAVVFCFSAPRRFALFLQPPFTAACPLSVAFRASRQERPPPSLMPTYRFRIAQSPFSRSRTGFHDAAGNTTPV